jgi:hypothetical protein
MMSGVASARYQSPAIHSFAANHFYDEDLRPLGAVSIAGAPVPNALDIGTRGQATQIASLRTISDMLSERNDHAWRGLRGRRELTPHPNFDGSPVARPLATNPMDRWVLDQTRGLGGQTNASTDRMIEQIYEMHKTVSRQLGLDIASTVENTRGFAHLADDIPFWADRNRTLGIEWGVGNGGNGGDVWDGDFDLALRLLKSGVTSAVSLEARASGGNLDTHSTGGQQLQFLETRTVLEVIGRLLGEMKLTNIGNGKTLLDDTLVIISSEFARTFSPSQISGSDHWPITSTVFVGGGVSGNRAIGDYILPPTYTGLTGPNGAPVDLILEGDVPGHRPPTSADVIRTALLILGLSPEEFFIPGGPGEIVGVAA